MILAWVKDKFKAVLWGQEETVAGTLCSLWSSLTLNIPSSREKTRQTHRQRTVEQSSVALAFLSC